MALFDPYFTKEEYYSVMKKPIATAAEDTDVTRGALTVSRFLDKVTNRGPYGKDAAPTARQVRASNDSYLDLSLSGLPGIATATGFALSIDGTPLVPATDLAFLPLLADVNGQPFTEIEFIEGVSPGTFYSTNGWLTVTAVWGWPAVPEIIKDTAMELLGIWREESPRATGRMNELQDVVNNSDYAKQLVNRFIKSMRTAAIA
jgi:hypothetical protein